MTGALSPTHWAIVLVVVLLVFGAKRLPDAARGLGQSMRIFKAETAQLNNDHTEQAGERGGEEVPRAVARGEAGSTTPAPAGPASSSASVPSSGTSRVAEPTS